jgi:hypothetical protein
MIITSCWKVVRSQKKIQRGWRKKQEKRQEERQEQMRDQKRNEGIGVGRGMEVLENVEKENGVIG